MKQPNPFKDEKSSTQAPRYYSGSNPLEREPPRPAPQKAPQDRKVPVAQRGGG